MTKNVFNTNNLTKRIIKLPFYESLYLLNIKIEWNRNNKFEKKRLQNIILVTLHPQELLKEVLPTLPELTPMMLIF